MDTFQSPDTWSLWGMSESDSFGWINSFDTDTNRCQADEENHRRVALDEGHDAILLEESEDSISSFAAGGWSQGLPCGNTMVNDLPEFMFNDLTRSDQMDDMVLYRSSLLGNSVLEAENTNDTSYHLSSESQFNSMLVDGCSTDLMVDSQSASVVSSPRSSNNAHFPQILHRSFGISNGDYRNSGNGCVGGEMALEESVLDQLGMVLTQVPENTRLCFRDSFYRLSQNPIQCMPLQGRVRGLALKEPSETIPGYGRIRSVETGTAESENSYIDRAVTSFTFNKLDVNSCNLFPAPSF